MGISPQVFNRIQNIIRNKSILEFGDQQFTQNIYTDEFKGLIANGWFKDIEKEINSKIVSVDITGRNNSLPLDLSKPIELDQQFDIVTNFGTSEHIGETIEDQVEVYKNMFKYCKRGGIIINEIPEKGHWKGHCQWYPTQHFFFDLAMGHSLLFFEKIYYEGNGNNLFSVIQKLNDNLFLPAFIHMHKSDDPVTINEYWKK